MEIRNHTILCIVAALIYCFFIHPVVQYYLMSDSDLNLYVNIAYQMREGFDSGEKTKFTEDDNPHDVAALFKEYLRDLPEPLLTRELYAAFLESQSRYMFLMQPCTLALLGHVTDRRIAYVIIV